MPPTPIDTLFMCPSILLFVAVGEKLSSGQKTEINSVTAERAKVEFSLNTFPHVPHPAQPSQKLTL